MSAKANSARVKCSMPSPLAATAPSFGVGALDEAVAREEIGLHRGR